MNDIKNKVFVITVILVFAIIITACSSTPNVDNSQQNVQNSPQVNPDNSNPVPPSDNNQAPQVGWQNRTRGQGQFGNMTPEQRQQMMATMIQQVTDACQGMNDGDNCTIQNQRGNRTGTCATQNGTIMCNAGFNRQRPTG